MNTVISGSDLYTHKDQTSRSGEIFDRGFLNRRKHPTQMGTPGYFQALY